MSRAVAAAFACIVIASSPALAEPIDECGFIESLFGCHFFVPLSGEGDYVLDIPAVPDSLGYEPIRVVGNAAPCGHLCEGSIFIRCITDCTLSACEPVDLGCGVLARHSSASVNEFCWLWTSRVHGSFLTYSHGYAVGDTVRAVALLDRVTASTCLVGDGFLWYEALTDCPDTLSQIEPVTWGTLKSVFR